MYFVLGFCFLSCLLAVMVCCWVENLKLGARFLIGWMTSGLEGGCCLNSGLEFWLCVCVISDLVGCTLGSGNWPELSWGRIILPVF